MLMYLAHRLNNPQLDDNILSMKVRHGNIFNFNLGCYGN